MIEVNTDRKQYKIGVNKVKKLIFSYLTAVSVMAAALSGCGSISGGDQKGLERQPEQEAALPRNGMFEWDEDRIFQPEQVELLIDTLSVTDWYQEIALPVEQEGLEAFIECMAGKGIAVYALVGEKEWGYEEDGASLISYMEEIRAYNEIAGPDQSFQGIMADIEPYVMKKWKDDTENYMEAYVNGMIQAYQHAREWGLEVIVCIPRHYDDQGLSKQLERLIAEGCDQVAVMNYECGNEVDKIRTEAGLAQKYNKRLHCILEFQEVGKHGLVEEKTYRNKGIAAAWKAWEQVEQAYPDMTITRDYHYSRPLMKMLEEEEKIE